MWIIGSRKYESARELLEDIDYTDVISHDEFNEWFNDRYGSVWVAGRCYDAAEVLEAMDEDDYELEYVLYVGDKAEDLIDEWIPKLEDMLPTEIVELFGLYDVEYEEDEEDA